MPVKVDFFQFSGTKNVYGFAAGFNGKMSGYQQMGMWNPNPNGGITYHNGPVMTGTTKIYYIWYGTWSGNTATSILQTLAANIGGSPYFNINTTYTNANGVRLSNSVQFAGYTSVPYPYGRSLTDDNIRQIVADAINSKAVPLDANGVYFVLTSADVYQSATAPYLFPRNTFCMAYCGWHKYTSINGTSVKYAFVGNPEQQCPITPTATYTCEYQAVSPNGNAGADSMADSIAHELNEAVTDPDLTSGWNFWPGWEISDTCEGQYGGTSSLSNGAKYNVILGGLKFLIQENWVNGSSGYRALKY
jgi:hypothetical protein